MKRVIKNVLKSTAIICLILEIASTIFFGLYTLELNKAYKNNDKEWTQGLISVGKSYREQFAYEDNEDGNKELGMLVSGVLAWIRLETTTMILLMSIVIGIVVGVAMSVDENSKKKVLITYISMYIVLALILAVYETLKYGSVELSNLFALELEGLGIYTVIYVLTVLIRKINNNRKVKKMNEELKEKN